MSTTAVTWIIAGELRGQTKAESELEASEERADAKQQDLSNGCARMNTLTN
jgi:hypothetical protein